MSQKIRIIQRDTITINFILTNEDGQPIDLTETTLFFTVKKRLGQTDDDAVISKEVTDHINEEAGETAVTLGSAETDVKSGNYYWDIQLQRGNNILSTEYGLLTVVPDVTRRTL